ncbi:hypothetical protein H2O64_22200 [Kordia sp. YSTF-M3]|uniref:Uncharacterized protein n=1 Tax=Kordia aestuariivivens TaxID=2759037 RepID=A0ABR7QFY0_9FLAO|nr:hypothetical protein [Kordia aestuariivivens]MBC8757398.1 hypothetical protein [Kordia aestuariivivens]
MENINNENDSANLNTTASQEMKLNSDVKNIASELAGAIAKQMSEDALKDDASDIGMVVGGVITGGIASAVVNVLLDIFFPPSGKSMVDAIGKEVAKIVDDALSKKFIEDMNSATSSVQTSLKTEYAEARKTDNASLLLDRQNMYNLLNKYDTSFISGDLSLMGELTSQSSKYQESGFPVFLWAASIRLLIYQEMANVDPTNSSKGFNPLKSSYGIPKTGTVAQNASDYATIVESVWPKILKKRKSFIKKVETNDMSVGTTMYYVDEFISKTKKHGRLVLESRFAHRDKGGGFLGYMKGHGPENAKKIRVAYEDKVCADLTKSMNDPLKIASDWRKLIDNPLNMKVGT